MTGKHQISEEEKQAVVNYLSGRITTGESRILKNWLSKSHENKLLVDQLSDVWNAAGFREKVNTGQAWDSLREQINLSQQKNNRIYLAVFLRYAAVFIVALFLGGLGLYMLNPKNAGTAESSFIEYVSPLGSRSSVQLSDGSKIWLNAGTTLRYRNSYGTLNRELFLSGEAFFKVAKDETLPLVVKTDEIDIIALGTRFNVKAYAEEETIETTLIEGSVKLVASAGKLADDIVLKPNEKAVYTRVNQSFNRTEPDQSASVQTKNAKLQIIESIEAAPVISWKNKRWVIQNEKLGDLAVKLERRFNVNFIFENEQLKEYSFGGTLEDESLEQIMEAIGFSSPIKYRIDKNTVYITREDSKTEKVKNFKSE